MTNKPKPYTRRTGSQSEIPVTRSLGGKVIEVGGYQRYKVSKNKVKYAKPVHRLKYAVIKDYLIAYYRTSEIVDIGCSAGVIGIQAYLDGCRSMYFLDHDSEYIKVVREVMQFIGYETANARVGKLSECKDRFEVGIAFALIHWIYSYSERSGSLQDAIHLLYRMAPHALFLEWVSPNDPAIQQAEHIRQNKSVHKAPYTFQECKKALEYYYDGVHFLGKVNKTRSIWLATSAPLVKFTRIQWVRRVLTISALRASTALSENSQLKKIRRFCMRNLTTGSK